VPEGASEDGALRAAQLRSFVDFDWRRAFEICGAGTRGPCIHEEWGVCAGRRGGGRTGDGEMHGCGESQGATARNVPVLLQWFRGPLAGTRGRSQRAAKPSLARVRLEC
jgi:hypothetical protein